MNLLRTTPIAIRQPRPLTRRLLAATFFRSSSTLIPRLTRTHPGGLGIPSEMDDLTARFETLMQRVYGPYDLSAQPDAAWEPGNAGGHRGRYLWTDAFGVINFVTLSRETPFHGPAYLHLARQLADTVHDVLGREREGVGSPARLPGATDAAPLRGGLRIGKLSADGRDCDGMYHHYLTLWMYALDVLARATGEARWSVLAVQLAQTIHPRFIVERDGVESMVWKITTDMSHALVGVPGHLDDVTGFVVYRMLRDTARRFGTCEDGVLTAEIEQYARIMKHHDKSKLSGDPLDLGMGLWVAHFDREAGWSHELTNQACHIARSSFLEAASKPITASSRRHRLAFREFGACLGIKCYEKGLESLLDGVQAVLDVWKHIMIEDENDEDGDSTPINLVMYAAALIPGAFRKGYLED